MTVYCGIIGMHTMSIGVAVYLSWESGIMEREISLGSAIPGLILLTLGAAPSRTGGASPGAVADDLGWDWGGWPISFGGGGHDDQVPTLRACIHRFPHV